MSPGPGISRRHCARRSWWNGVAGGAPPGGRSWATFVNPSGLRCSLVRQRTPRPPTRSTGERVTCPMRTRPAKLSWRAFPDLPGARGTCDDAEGCTPRRAKATGSFLTLRPGLVSNTVERRWKTSSRKLPVLQSCYGCVVRKCSVNRTIIGASWTRAGCLPVGRMLVGPCYGRRRGRVGRVS